MSRLISLAALSTAIGLSVAVPLSAERGWLPGERDDIAILLPSDPYYSWAVAHMTNIVRRGLLHPASAIISNMAICVYSHDYKMAVLMVRANDRNDRISRDKLAVAVETNGVGNLVFTEDASDITLQPMDVSLDLRMIALGSSERCIKKYSAEQTIVEQHK